jgi:hypothetical protein
MWLCGIKRSASKAYGCLMCGRVMSTADFFVLPSHSIESAAPTIQMYIFGRTSSRLTTAVFELGQLLAVLCSAAHRDNLETAEQFNTLYDDSRSV